MSRLTITNSWEITTYHWDGEILDPFQVQALQVNTPAGPQWFDVVWKEVSVRVGDHGHRYMVHQVRPYLTVNVYGLEFKLRLDPDEFARVVDVRMGPPPPPPLQPPTAPGRAESVAFEPGENP